MYVHDIPVYKYILFKQKLGLTKVNSKNRPENIVIFDKTWKFFGKKP